MAIKLTVKEGNNERSWDVMDGQQIDINMAKGAEYTLIDTQTGQTPDGMRVVNNHGQTEIYGSDTFPWVTLHDEGADEPAAPDELPDTDTIRRSVERLPETYRNILRLRLFGQMRFADIAAALRANPSSVRVQYTRGLSRLRKLLTRKEEG